MAVQIETFYLFKLFINKYVSIKQRKRITSLRACVINIVYADVSGLCARKLILKLKRVKNLSTESMHFIMVNNILF